MLTRNLYARVAIPIVAVIAAALVAVTLTGMAYKRHVVTQVAFERARSLSAITRDSIEHMMRVDHDADADLRPLFERLATNPDISAARILSPQGEVLHTTRPLEIGRRLPVHLQQRNQTGDAMGEEGATPRPIVHTVQPMRTRAECRSCHKSAGPVIGFLDVDLNVGQPLAGLQAWRTMTTVLGVFLLVTVVALVSVILKAIVVSPIHRLLAAMKRVQTGDLTVRVASEGTAEIHALGDGFNAMVGKLREAARAEEESRQVKMERVEQLAAVGELAAGLAHEIKNPLSGVQAALEVLAGELPLDDENRPILQESAAALARIDFVVRDLLRYARPKAPVLAPADVNQIVHDALIFTQAQAARQSMELTTALAPALPAVVADADMIRQVLLNLIINALHAAGQRAGGRVEISTDARDGAVLCRVRDNGPGVPMSDAETIFRPFVTTKAQGTGLGLAISRRLVELHDGRLWLENPGEPGASFAVSLPVAHSQDVPRAAA